MLLSLVDDPENVDAPPAEVDLVEHAALLRLDVVQEQEQRVEQVVPAGGELQLATALAVADLKNNLLVSRCHTLNLMLPPFLPTPVLNLI